MALNTAKRVWTFKWNAADLRRIIVPITEQEIKDLDVDGGVELIVLALLAEIDALKAQPSETVVPDEYTMT